MIRIVTSSSGQVGTATVPGWAVALGGVAAVALGLVVLIVGAGLALVLAPLAIGAAMFARWRFKKALREAGIDLRAGSRPASDVIDGEYRVVDEPKGRLTP